MTDRTGWGRGSTRRWRRFRASTLAEDPRCQSCLANGRVTLATEVHHVVPLSKGGDEYDPANVIQLCEICHQRATTSARTGRIKGWDAEHNRPLDPNHPWNKP